MYPMLPCSVSRLSILDGPLCFLYRLFTTYSLSYVLCTLCCHVVSLDCPLFCWSSSCVLCCQFIWIVHWFVCLRHVSCVASLSGLSIVLFVYIPCLVLAVYLDCPLFCWSSSCVLCCQFIWIVHCFVCLRPVSCVASLSGLSFYIAPSVFSNMYLSCVLCILCCQFLWIVLLHYPFGIL